WHDEASALYYALNYETLTSWFGIWLRSYPALLKMITRSVVPFELSMPVLLLLPFGFPYFRLAALALAVLFHLGIMLCLRLYYFPHVCLVALIPFVPCLVWNRVWPSGSSQDQHERLCGPSVAAAATLLGIVVAWNVSTLGQGPAALPKWLQKAVYAVRLDQDWGFYSPYPYKDDGWYVIPAVLGNGNIVDLFGDNGHALTWTRPASLAGQYPNQHWAAFHILMRERGNEFNYLNYSRYLCRQQKTMSLKLVYMLKLTLPDGPATARPIELYSHSCL
ncbi:MAG: hypothetical protein HY074_08960, partial [Deltaproteobacteria bacterium]|nr:hypothetical protein [Deltaproteobacteria bacterium]